MAILSNYLAKIRMTKVAPYVHGDILDLGCGEAKMFREYGARMNSYCGVEICRETVEKLRRQYPDSCFLCRDLDEEPLDLDKKFDCVLMIALIEHLFNQKRLMDQVAGLLKPGGCVVITTPTIFGNDVVHRAGAAMGFLAKSIGENHSVIYNRQRLSILAKRVGLTLKRYRMFEMFCNQIAVLTK